MNRTTLATLGLALAVGAAGTASGQSTQQPPRREGAEQGQRDHRGGPEAMLLKGITLSADQKARIDALRKEGGAAESREQFRKAMTDARAARERGDTAAAKSQMQQLRTKMDAQREQHLASIRSVLTTEQQRQFDVNIATWKQRAADHQKERGDRQGGRPGRNGSSSAARSKGT